MRETGDTTGRFRKETILIESEYSERSGAKSSFSYTLIRPKIIRACRPNIQRNREIMAIIWVNSLENGKEE